MKGNFTTKYKPEFVEIAAELVENGAINIDIAKHLGVSIATFFNWKHKYPDLKKAVTIAKEGVDDHVEDTLYRRATGYVVKEDKIVVIEGKIHVVTVDKHIVPDVTAQIFWLKNRRPHEWRDKQDIDHYGAFSVKIEGSDADSL